MQLLNCLVKKICNKHLCQFISKRDVDICVFKINLGWGATRGISRGCGDTPSKANRSSEASEFGVAIWGICCDIFSQGFAYV